MDTIIQNGSKGLLVIEAQGLLNSYFGAVKLKPDGSFGPRTESTVKDFQNKVKLSADGKIGPDTWKALRARGAVHEASRPAEPDLFDINAHRDFLKRVPPKPTRPLPPNVTPSHVPGRPIVPKPGVTEQEALAPDLPAIFSAKDLGNYSRTSFEGYEGRSYVINDFMKFKGAAIELLPHRRLRGPNSPDRLKINNQCAHFVQYFGLPHTSHWRRGPRVCALKTGELARGTVIATLRDGKYYSDRSGRSHVGLYLHHTNHEEFLRDPYKSKGSIWMFDQYQGVDLNLRQKFYSLDQDAESRKTTTKWVDSTGTTRSHRVQWVNDGEEYYVLLSTQE